MVQTKARTSVANFSGQGTTLTYNNG